MTSLQSYCGRDSTSVHLTAKVKGYTTQPMQTSLTKHRIAKTFLTFQRYQAISDLFQAFSHLAYYPKKKLVVRWTGIMFTRK